MKISFHELSGARDKQDKTDILLDTEMYMQNYSYFVFVCVLQRERESWDFKWKHLFPIADFPVPTYRHEEKSFL